MERKIPINIEELLRYGDFDEKEIKKLYSEITNVIIKMQLLEGLSRYSVMMKKPFWNK